MTQELKEYQNLLNIKNHLICLSERELEKMYESMDFYLAFIHTIFSLIENEGGVLLLDEDYIKKVLAVLQIHRFDCPYKEIKEDINGIIECLNGVKAYPESLKNGLKNAYLAYQEEQREITFNTKEALAASLSYDAIVFNAIQNGHEEDIKHDKYYVMSLNYLLKTCPELFEESQKETAMEALNKFEKNTKLFSFKKKYIRKAKKSVKELKKEE